MSSTFATKEDTAQRDKLEQEVRAKYAAKLSGGGGASVQPQTPLTPGGGGGGAKKFLKEVESHHLWEMM